MLSTSLKKSKEILIGILCKLRFYVQTSILENLYYALIYLFLIYGLLAWGMYIPNNLAANLFVAEKGSTVNNIFVI